MATAHVLRVRHLQRADLDRWRVLWDGYVSFYRADVPAEVTDRTFSRLVDEGEGLVGLVCVDSDDQPVGLAHLVFHSGTWTSAGHCYLEDLFVHPAHRGGAAARALIDAVFVAAGERGVQRVYWHTQEFNGAARSLYDTVARLTSLVVYEVVLT